MTAVDILLVDDQPRNLAALTAILDEPQYNCVHAGSGAEALRLVLARAFAVIVLDVFMPEMDGIEVATLIKSHEQFRATPIIFLTAAGEDLERIHHAYSLGAVDYLLKPVMPEVVRAKVGFFVELYRRAEKIKRQAELLREHDRREREREVAETRAAGERRYRDLAELIPQLVWRADAAGVPTYFTRRWWEYARVALDSESGSGWLEIVHPDDREPFLTAWRNAVGDKKPFQAECRLRRGADSAFLWHLCLATPVADGWMGTFTDIDERKRAEEERGLLLRETEGALEARDEFLSIAAHELRTPVASLSLQIQSLSRHARGDVREPLSEATIGRQLDLAERQIGRLSSLIGALFDVSRIASSQMRLDLEDVDLAEIVREVGARFSGSCAEEGSDLVISVDGSLVGRCDPMRVEQMVANLLSNALKFGAGRPIALSAARVGDDARVTVKDEGIGIPRDAQARIFERFERAASAVAYGGLGLGLHITRSLALAHGGSIEVESDLGKGAEFRLTLPLTRA